MSHPENSAQPHDLVTRAREADPALDGVLTAARKQFGSEVSLRHVALDGEQQGAPLTCTRRDEEGYRARVAAWKAAGSPEPPGCSLPPMRGPAYKKRGKR